MGRGIIQGRSGSATELDRRTKGKAVAMVWLLSGTPEDLDRAKIKGAELGYRVFDFDEREENPLEATKNALLKEK